MIILHDDSDEAIIRALVKSSGRWTIDPKRQQNRIQNIRNLIKSAAHVKFINNWGSSQAKMQRNGWKFVGQTNSKDLGGWNGYAIYIKEA